MEARTPAAARMIVVALALASFAASAAAEEPAAAPKGQGSGSAERQIPDTGLPRESEVETSLGRTGAGAGNAFGGYGELTLSSPSDGPAIVDLRRFVLFFGHDYSEHIRFYSEVEVEHAISSAEDSGEVEIELFFELVEQA